MLGVLFKDHLLKIRVNTVGKALSILHRFSYHWLKRLNYLEGAKYDISWYLPDITSTAGNNNNAVEPIITNECCVIGKTRFIIKNKKASLNIYTKQAIDLENTFSSYFLQEEAIGIAEIKESQIFFKKEITPQVTLKGEYISLLNPASENWMHFVTEILPAICEIKGNKLYRNIGLIIDKNIPKQFKDLINKIHNSQNIIEVESGVVICVEKLLTPCTQNSYSAFWDRKKTGATGSYQFDEKAIRKVKKEVELLVDKSPENNQQIFIKRNSHRIIVNQNEIIGMLKMHGFRIVEPEKNSLDENINIFSNAKTVVAQAGAALANMIFMPEGSTLICLIAESEYINKKYFEDFSQICDIDFKALYVMVDNPKLYKLEALCDHCHPMNSVFTIDKKKLIQALQ